MPAPRSSALRVLLVHRDPPSGARLRDALAGESAIGSVDVVTCSCEAVRHAVAAGPDVVVARHDPPWVDGVEVMRAVDRVASGRCTFVVLDADDPSTAVDAVRAGASGAGVCVVPRATVHTLMTPAPRRTQETLSARELEVLDALARGLTNSEIASALYVSRETVKSHVAHVLRKLGVTDRRAAAARGAELGLCGAVAPLHPGRTLVAADGPRQPWRRMTCEC